MIGISLHSGGMVDKPLTWVIRHIAAIGYDGIEIVCGPNPLASHICTVDLDDQQLKDIRGELEANNIKVAAINPYGVASLGNMDPNEALPFYRKLIDIAVALGASGVNFLPGRLPDGDSGAWRKIITTVKPLLHYAAGRDVCMSIHNHENHTLDTPEKVRLIIELTGLDNLKSLCDITNFWILGSRIDHSVKLLADHISHCHVKGVLGKFPFNHFLVPGEEGDQFPFDEFAKSLGETGYERFISVEVFSFMREDKTQIAYDMMSASLANLGLREVGNGNGDGDGAA